MGGADAIVSCAIHPGIGIARVGDSLDAFFIGPEAPGHAPTPVGGFKDAAGRVKRQAALFHIYGYSAAGEVVRELTAADASITWTVHLVNRKGGAPRLSSAAATAAEREVQKQSLRNAAIVNTPAAPAARDALVIDPGPRSIAGADKHGDAFRLDGGSFLGRPAPLGELRTDDQGRLLVLGGAGAGSAINPALLIADDTDNDGWFDDTSDGPVSAHVLLAGGVELPVRGAWVIVAPPDFSPQTTHLVTLYDVMQGVARRQGWLAPPSTVSFTDDVYPILARLAGYQWVNALALRGHGPRTAGDLLAPDTLAKLSDAGETQRENRERIFRMLRNPTTLDASQASRAFMPLLSGDGGAARDGEPTTWLSLLPGQYAVLQRWAAGDFQADWLGTPSSAPLATIPVAEQPNALDRAALEGCVGGAFAPGVEIGRRARDPAIYAEPFRISAALQPGDLTQELAVPWHASCFGHSPNWWPAQRPDDVVMEATYRRALTDFPTEAEKGLLAMTLRDRVPWSRGIGTQRHYDGPPAFAGHNDMVARWSQLGFVEQQVTAQGEEIYVECERSAYALLKDREHYFYLLNIEDFPDYLPAAQALAEELLAEVRRHQASPNLAATLRPFPYSYEAMCSRLDEIYNLLATVAETPAPAANGMLKSWEDAAERILQTAPFNQIDGAWLRHFTPNGPLGEVETILTEIWWEETGAGHPAQNHANLASDLMRYLGFDLPHPASRTYADNPRFLDAAFTLPAFELSLSQFSRRYLPELLGFTLQEEWEVLEVKPFIASAKRFGIPMQFYEIHVGIDNAASGHGAKAKRAVQLYLERVRAEGGDVAVQETWERFWTGYNILGAAGTLLGDLARRMGQKPTTHARMVAIIEQKGPYASRNHGQAKLGDKRINEWFADPDGFLAALAASPLIAPGKPEESAIFSLFTTDGPMYGVFSVDEQQTWRDWIRSLAEEPVAAPAPAQPSADAGSDADLARSMASLLDAMRPSVHAAPESERVLLIGPDPDEPDKPMTQSLSWWFSQPTVVVMATLRHVQNKLVAGDAAASALLSMLSGLSLTAPIVVQNAVSSQYASGAELIALWIERGCPLLPDLPRLRPSLTMSPATLSGLPPAYLRGMGTVH